MLLTRCSVWPTEKKSQVTTSGCYMLLKSVCLLLESHTFRKSTFPSGASDPIKNNGCFLHEVVIAKTYQIEFKHH